MGRLFAGILYCSLWYSTIVAGFTILTLPGVVILLISPTRFAIIGDFVFSFWEIYATILLQQFGVKIVVTGERINSNEAAILVMNHRTRVDWNFLWGAMYKVCFPKIANHKLKIILKDNVRHVPGPGWIMQMTGFIYVTRHWEEDKRRLRSSLDQMVSMERRCQILIFPEGTDFTAKSKEKSDKYAEQKGLPKYDYTLHPKTTGFTFLVQHLRNANFLDAVYDLTIGYPDCTPQQEVDFLYGNFPKEVHINIKKYRLAEIPSDEADLRTWLEKKWVEKEKMLIDFAKNKYFHPEHWPEVAKGPMYVASIFWNVLVVVYVTLLILSPIFRFVFLFEILFFVGLSFTSINFGQIVIAYYNMLLRYTKAKTN